MFQQTPIVINEDFSVHQELHSLGLTVDIVTSIARKAAAAKAEALEIDPSSTPGTLAYINGVRAIRMDLLPLGWRLSRTGNVEATVNDKLGIQICFQNVDIRLHRTKPSGYLGEGGWVAQAHPERPGRALRSRRPGGSGRHWLRADRVGCLRERGFQEVAGRGLLP